MKELIGKFISGLKVNENESILVFDHPDGTTTSYKTEADCCSETWFADITGVMYLLGEKIISVEEVKLASVDDGRTRQEYDNLYGIKIVTSKGYIDIVFRNSSNGYYGGDISEYKGELPETLVNITNDWSA